MGQTAATPDPKQLQRMSEGHLAMERECYDRHCRQLAAQIEEKRRNAPYVVPWQLFACYNDAVEYFQRIMQEIERRHIP
jgi:glutamyl/glutaminyl-tRNA synthetase